MEKIYVSKNIFELKDAASKIALERYLDGFKKYVLENDVDLEIYEDIKDRIEEKLTEIQAKNWDIDKKSIELLIEEIGKPEEILSEAKRKKDKGFDFTIPKIEKFHKDSKAGKILWVCYGLGKSLDIEPIWVRVFFIILFFATNVFAIILYVLLAVVLPDENERVTADADYSWSEWTGRKFFSLLRQFWHKMISLLK